MWRQPGKNTLALVSYIITNLRISQIIISHNSSIFSPQMCLNGKCVYEHENEVDYDGFGFLRRSGKITDDKLIETPSEKRQANVEYETIDFFLVNGSY